VEEAQDFDIFKQKMLKKRFSFWSKSLAKCMCCCPSKTTVGILKREETLFSFEDCFSDIKNIDL